MTTDYETIRVDVSDDGIAHIVLNRPRVLNAINSVLMREVTEVLSGLQKEPSVRCFVLSGEGRSFSAGFDLKESAAAGDRSVAEWRRVLEADFDFVMQFWDCPKPTISAIHGHCIGGGLNWRSPVTSRSPRVTRFSASPKCASVPGSSRWCCPG